MENSRFVAISVDLLISPEISDADKDSFERATSDIERNKVLVHSGNELIRSLLADTKHTGHLSNFLVWLIAAGKLAVKFALPRHLEHAGMFHQKTGVFEFPDGDRVAFDGSANESDSGYRRNYESLQVFRSWCPGDHERLTLVAEEFDRQWNHKDADLLVVPLTDESLALIRA